MRVKHQRQGRGSEGTLVLYDRRLVYLTEQEEASRQRGVRPGSPPPLPPDPLRSLPPLHG